MPTPLDQDILIAAVAEQTGLAVYRRDRIEVDRGHLPEAFWSMQPDYSRIRKALERGDDVPGVQWLRGCEWVLKEQDHGGE